MGKPGIPTVDVTVRLVRVREEFLPRLRTVIKSELVRFASRIEVKEDPAPSKRRTKESADGK